MQCPRCQHENPPGMKFCAECAAPLAATCPSCGAANLPENKFCGQCAAPLDKPAPPRFAVPESYTPKHLAEKILTSKAALEGERKQVTVLFADLKSSLELLAEHDPEEARALLDPVLERMMEAVHHYEGTVNQVMGDGIMALFGAPLAHEDHAIRACYAAIRMQESIKRFATEFLLTSGVPIQIRVGVNSGEVVVRSVKSDLRVDYSAVGQTTHVAARLEQIARPGSTLISAETFLLVEGYVQVKPIGPVAVKGLRGLIEVYEIVGAGPARRRVEALVNRGLTRFVGRETELAALRSALAKARAGSGQVVTVAGEPGVGKSRLFWEFTRSHPIHDWILLKSASVSYGRATPYLPLIDILKAYFQIDDSDRERQIREKVSEKLTTLDETLTPMLPAFLTLLDVSVDDSEWHKLDPSQRRQLTLEACKRLLLRESQIQPLMLIFEDLHWIDSETQAFLNRLVESLPAARLLLLVNYRPEFKHGWRGKTCYTELHVNPLAPEDAEQLLQALLGSDAGLVPLRRLLMEQTEGNPFFLEESVRTLVEMKVLTGDRGNYRLTKPVGTIQVPATVQAVLAARIDRLPPEEKRLLQSAAVIGKNVPVTVLRALTDLTASALRRRLSSLQAADFLYQVGLVHGADYTFRHALTHEVAYGSILNERRRRLHVEALRALERLYADRLGEQIERLAHHAVRGEVWDLALTYLRRAAAKAFGQSAHREAVGYLEQARETLKHLPESREILEQAIDIRFDLRNSLLPLGEHGRYVEYLHEADSIATRLADQHRLGWIAAYTTAYLYLFGDEDAALASGERALQLAEPLKDLSLHVSTHTWLGQVHYHRGDYRRASELFTRNVKGLTDGMIRERFGLPQLPSVHSRTCLIWCLGELGEFADGIERGEEGLRIAESVDHPLSLLVACAGLGIVRLWKGDLEQAIPLLERGIELSGAWNIPLWLPRLASALGYAYALSGRLREAMPLLERAVEKAASMGLMGGHSRLVSYLGEGHLLAARIGEAAQLGNRALQLARQHQERGYEAWALRLIGEIALRSSPADLEAAADHCNQAIALGAPLGMRPMVARTRLILGLAEAQAGHTTRAKPCLAGAAQLFSEMAMPFWLAQAEAELARLA